MAINEHSPHGRWRTILLVAAVASFSALVITAAWEVSHERIAENQRAALLASLRSVAGERAEANVMPLELSLPPDDSNQPVLQLFAMHDGTQLIAWVYFAVAPIGYNGPIDLLVGIRPNGTITSVRVVSHRETPGLGDAIETEKSDWIRQFDDKSLGDPARWALKIDNGSFDSITGATITPRAVVAAIESVLRYHSDNRGSLEALFAAAQTQNHE